MTLPIFNEMIHIIIPIGISCEIETPAPTKITSFCCFIASLKSVTSFLYEVQSVRSYYSFQRLKLSFHGWWVMFLTETSSSLLLVVMPLQGLTYSA